MYEVRCPSCGRHLLLTDTPPGYQIVAPCQRGRGQKRIRTGEPPKKPPPGRPDPLRYR